jgi:general stress protein 26
MGTTPGAGDRGKFVEVLRRFDTAMLVTHAKEGGLRSRPMALAEIEDDGTTWFVTASDTEKTEEIGPHGDVNVAFQAGMSFASLTGDAELVRDKAKARDLWQEPWRVWFPDGPEESDLVLVRIRPQVGEYWDQRGSKGLRYAWEAAKAYAKGEKLGDNDDSPRGHGKVEL